MQLSRVQALLNAQIWTDEEALESEIFSACGCDLMSDVLAFAKEKILLLTGLINPQVVRTAELLDIKAIVFVRGKSPTEDMIKLAEERGIMLLSTHLPLYMACGILYEAGLRGTSE